MHSKTDKTIRLYWPCEALFRKISEETLYNARNAADGDPASMTDDERMFFDNNIADAASSLVLHFRHIVPQDGGLTLSQAQIAIVINAESTFGSAIPDSDIIGLDNASERYLMNVILHRWYTSIQVAALAQYYATQIAASDLSLEDILFNFSRPTYNGTGYEVVEVCTHHGHAGHAHHGHQEHHRHHAGHCHDHMHHGDLIGIKRVYMDSSDRVVVQYTNGRREVVGQIKNGADLVFDDLTPEQRAQLQGADGKGIEFVFHRQASPLPPPAPPSSNSDGAVPEGWHASQPAVVPAEPNIFVSQRVKISGNWSAFSAPALCARYASDGRDGEGYAVLDLSNENASVACDFNGNVVGNIPTSQATVYEGAGVAPGWTLSAAFTGCEGAINNGLITVSALSEDNATVAVSAKKTGHPELRATYTLSKVKAGAPGGDAVIYSILPSVSVIWRNKNGVLTPQQVSCLKMKQVGANTPTTTDEKTLKYQLSNGNETVYVSAVSIGDASFIDFILYDGGQIIDRERIPVVSDGRDGAGFAILDLSNENASVACDFEGNVVGDIPTSQATVYEGANVAAGWSLVAEFTGCEGVISNGLIAISVLSADNATVEVLASKTGYSNLTAIYTITKVKAGRAGEDAIIYSLMPSVSVISRDKNGVLNPQEVSCRKIRQAGANAPEETTEKTLKYLLSNGQQAEYTGPVTIGEATFIDFILYDGEKVIDRERVPVVSDGRDGEGYALLDLSNENASVACDHQGNVAGEIPTSQATVYEGMNIATGWTFTAAFTGCAGSINAAGLITITSMSADNATAAVTAKKTGYADLKAVYTLSKVKAGKTGEDAVIYSVMPSVSVIKKDKNGVLNPTSVACVKMKQTGAGAPAATTEKTLKYQLSNGAETAYTSAVSVGSAIYVDFILYDGDKVVDRERVPVVADGKDGEGHATLDLSNENASVACDFYGNVVGTIPTSQATVYEGMNIAAGWAFSAVFSGCTGSITAGVITINALDSDNAEVVVTAKKSGSSDLTATYTLIKVRAGTPGGDAVVYSLLPSVSVVKKNKMGVLTPTSVSCMKIKQVGAGAPAETSEMTLKYQLSSGTETAYSSAVAIGSANWIDFILYNGSTLIDRERVPVVADGADGKDGADGTAGMSGPMPRGPQEWSPIGEYMGSASIIDIVFIKGPGAPIYYKAKAGVGNIPVGTPVTDTAWWEPMNYFESIATNLLLAYGAVIAGFKFYDDRMESQDQTGGSPNFQVIGKTGEFFARKAFIGTRETGSRLEMNGDILTLYDTQGRVSAQFSNDPSSGAILKFLSYKTATGSDLYMESYYTRSSILLLNNRGDFARFMADGMYIEGADPMYATSIDPGCVSARRPDSTLALDIQGGYSLINKPVTTIYTHTTLTRHHHVVLCNAGAEITVTFPSNADIGKEYTVKNISSRRVYVKDAAGGILSNVMQSENGNVAKTWINDGTKWVLIATGM